MMRIVRLIVAALLLAATPSYAQKTPTAIEAENNANIKANGAGAITGPILNQLIGDIVSSFGGILAANTWSLTQTFTVNPIFSACTGPLVGNGSSAAACAAVLAASNGGTGLTSFSKTGSTTVFATSTGTLSNGHCVSIDSNGNFVDAGGTCTTGGGGGTVAWNYRPACLLYRSNDG